MCFHASVSVNHYTRRQNQSTYVIAAIIRKRLQIIVPSRSWKRATVPLGIVFFWSFHAGQRNITRIQELIGHNKVCVTFGQTDVCISLCVCKLLQPYKCLNLGSILTTCHCHTWEMTSYHYLTLLWSKFYLAKVLPEKKIRATSWATAGIC